MQVEKKFLKKRKQLKTKYFELSQKEKVKIFLLKIKNK